MSTAASTLDGLRRERPEWGPWLDFVHRMQGTFGPSPWDRVAHASAAAAERPVLAGAALTLDSALLSNGLAQLVATAEAAGLDASHALRQVMTSVSDPAAFFVATINDDRRQVSAMAGAHAEMVYPLLAFHALPFLHACRRADERRADFRRRRWRETYCPICAAWPAFVEVRGIERSRFARCGRCGSAWPAPLLKCLYCGTTEHARLLTLTPQHGRAVGAVEACRDCLHYTKTRTALQGCAPEAVYIEDLATAALDLAALENGFTRPAGLGCALAVTGRLDRHAPPG